MEIKDQAIQNLLNVIGALEIYQQENFDAWVIGALDSLFFMKATLFPQDPNEEVEGLNQEIIKALAAADSHRKERFEQKVQACIKQDTMLIKMYNNIFDAPRKGSEEPNAKISPEHALLIDLCYALELYLQRQPNVWAEGALDALRWVKVTFYPFEANPKIDPKTARAVTEVYLKWQEQFEDELRKLFGNDEMLRRICKELFS